MEDNLPTQVIGWTNWNNPKYPKYGYAQEPGNYERVRRIVADALRKNGYHWDGFVHQSADFGAPVFDNGTKELYSFRGWGKTMAMAYPDEIDDTDGGGYCDWAWAVKESNKELEKFPPKSEWLS